VVVQAADGTQLGAAVLERLLSPDDLVAKTVKLDIQLRPPAPEAWQVVIAPEGKLDEITRENNRYGFR
jgi:predicted PilT family ATPase